MKHSYSPPALLVFAAPFCALTLTCSAQVLTTTPGTTTTTSTTTVSVTPQPGVNAAGTVEALDSNGLSLRAAQGGLTVFQTTPSTEFMDTEGHTVARERITKQTPVTVFFLPSGNSLLATKVVTTGPLYSAGTLSEVSPGVLVIELPGASATPVRYVNNETTNYVDEKGDAVPPATVRPGAPVRVYYTKVGDTLVASKVEVIGLNGGGSSLPKPAVPGETTRTTTAGELNKR